MLEFLGFAVLAIIVASIFCLLVLFALGFMHSHLTNQGRGFGRDKELHDKLDRLNRNLGDHTDTKH